jgi:hypothetical protein
MNYLYLGYASLHLPAVAAALHLEQLDAAVVPAAAKLASLPYFRQAAREEDGRLFAVGSDSNGHQIYLLCVKTQPEVVARAVESLLGLYRLPLREAKIVPCLPDNPQPAIWGRILFRCGLHGLEKELAGRMARNSFKNLVRTVAEARQQ